MKTFTLAQFQKWGAQGGKKSKRKLTREQAHAMNEAKKAKSLTRSPKRERR